MRTLGLWFFAGHSLFRSGDLELCVDLCHPTATVVYIGVTSQVLEQFLVFELPLIRCVMVGPVHSILQSLRGSSLFSPNWARFGNIAVGMGSGLSLG